MNRNDMRVTRKTTTREGTWWSSPVFSDNNASSTRVWVGPSLSQFQDEHRPVTDAELAEMGLVAVAEISALAYKLDLEQEWGDLLDALDKGDH